VADSDGHPPWLDQARARARVRCGD
jgi:hypothetical protein